MAISTHTAYQTFETEGPNTLRLLRQISPCHQMSQVISEYFSVIDPGVDDSDANGWARNSKGLTIKMDRWSYDNLKADSDRLNALHCERFKVSPEQAQADHIAFCQREGFDPSEFRFMGAKIVAYDFLPIEGDHP